MPAPDSSAILAAKAYAVLRRQEVRKYLSGFYIPYFDNLCEALQGTFWVPYCGKRTFEQQQKLYDKIPKVTNARPGESPHNWGCATDWAEMRPEYVGTEIWNKANWIEFADAVRGCGMIWGGDFKSIIDKPHCELRISKSWKKIGEVYRTLGEHSAIIEIKNSIY